MIMAMLTVQQGFFVQTSSAMDATDCTFSILYRVISVDMGFICHFSGQGALTSIGMRIPSCYTRV